MKLEMKKLRHGVVICLSSFPREHVTGKMRGRTQAFSLGRDPGGHVASDLETGWVCEWPTFLPAKETFALRVHIIPQSLHTLKKWLRKLKIV